MATQTPDVLVGAARRLLKPLVTLLLTHGVTYPTLANLLKSLYVDVANKNFQIEGRPQTHSRISLLSGVHRKDVKRLTAEAGTLAPLSPVVSMGTQLVAKWVTDPEYLDERGRPRPLPRLAGTGAAPSFEGLVRAVSTDIRSRAVLDEWLRLGIATLNPEDRVVLKAEAFVPEKGFEEKVQFLAENVHDHLATAAHNVAGNTPAMMERAVFYEGLTDESVAELNSMTRERGMALLLEVNRRARELAAQDLGKEQARKRIHFGLYFHQATGKIGEDPDET
jgi:hypothetical protein